jgi:hypothetical protein
LAVLFVTNVTPSARMRRDVESVGADHRPTLLQVSTDVGVVKRRALAPPPPRTEGRPARAGILSGPGKRDLHTVEQLGPRDDRHADVIDAD